MYRTVFINILVLLGAFCVLSCSSKESITSLPFYNSPDFTPLFLTTVEERNDEIDHTISNFSLTDQNEYTFSQEDLKGKIHIANFIFTSCSSICPKMTNNLKAVQQKFRNSSDLEILSYSVTPWLDTPKRLKKYADLNDIDSDNWHLLTGGTSEIYDLARKAYFAEEDLGYTKDSTDFLHTEHIVLIDKTLRIRGIYNGTLPLEINQMMADIEQLLKEE